ncbi:hypothetical protein MKX01_016598, partial [Papaver californicum]
HLTEIQRVGNIGNATIQFWAPKISYYRNIGSVYGVPYVHPGNVAPTQGVLSGLVESVSPAFMEKSIF